MTDPVRDHILHAWAVDDPVSCLELAAPRARFSLAVGVDPTPAVDVAIERTLSLADALPRPITLRLILWGDAQAPIDEWFPGLAVTWHEGPHRRVATIDLHGLHGLQRALHAAWHEGADLDVWLWADNLLLRPYDDRGADLVAVQAQQLSPFTRRFSQWRLS